VNIQHLQYPFYHTIAYDVFNELKLQSVTKELKSLTGVYEKDNHHKNLKKNNKTEPFCIDVIYKTDRSKSFRKIKKTTIQDEFAFLGSLLNHDTIYI